MNKVDIRGFSLIEIIVALAIFSMVLAGLYGLLGGTVKYWDIWSRKIDMQQNARIALHMMEMDARAANFLMSNSNSSSLRLYVNNREIRYYLSGNQILKSTSGSGNNPVAYNISSLKYEYYPSVNQCELICVYIELDYGGVTYEYSSKINIRAINF